MNFALKEHFLAGAMLVAMVSRPVAMETNTFVMVTKTVAMVTK